MGMWKGCPITKACLPFLVHTVNQQQSFQGGWEETKEQSIWILQQEIPIWKHEWRCGSAKQQRKCGWMRSQMQSSTSTAWRLERGEDKALAEGWINMLIPEHIWSDGRSSIFSSWCFTLTTMVTFEDDWSLCHIQILYITTLWTAVAFPYTQLNRFWNLSSVSPNQKTLELKNFR